MTTLNPASNYSNLAQLNNTALNYTDSSSNIVENVIQSFLTDLSANTYTPMAKALKQAVTSIQSRSGNSTFRLLLATDDGTVAYDSSKSDSTNTYSNYLNGTINENHQGRPEILVALLGNTGTGLSNRFSRSLRTTLKYQATRLGPSTQSNLGTFRVSLNDFT